MKEGYRLLGDFIQPVDERNKELKVDYLLGVSISKAIHPVYCQYCRDRLVELQKLFVPVSLRMVRLHLGMEKRFRLRF